MENKNTVKQNDWMATVLTNQDTTVDDFVDNGINPTNTLLQDKDYYKDKPKIQKLFKNSDGSFDEKNYNKFYDQALNSYNDMSMKTFNSPEVIAKSYYENTLHAPKEARKRSASGHFEKVFNPTKEVIGAIGLNVTSANSQSIREIAQNNFVRDHETGESLGWKPNDDDKSGIFDFIFNTEPVVVAQYDNDGDHVDFLTGKKVRHSKGDYKTDNFGDLYYETLGNREAYGRQFLTMSDTLTTDGSTANEFDFMDSDGLDKSITGTIVKNAVQIAPYFIPGVNYAYATLNIATELSDAVPSLIKSMGTLFGSDLSDNQMLNQIQGFGKKMKGDVSDYSKSKNFTFENMANMVSDTFDQLYSQRMIAGIPGFLGSKRNQIAKYTDELNKTLGGEGLAKFGALNATEQASVIRKLAQTNKTIEKLQKQQQFWNTTGAKRISSLYMAATSSTQAYDDAKQAGFDTTDASLYYLGVFGGMFGLINNTEIGHWALKGMGVDDVSRGLNSIMKKESGTILNSMKGADLAYIKGAEEAKKKSLNFLSMLNAGKDAAKKAVNKFATGDINTILESATAEGIEEVSEEILQDALKNVTNTFNKLGLTSTEKDKAQFKFTAEDIMSRYAMSFIGGGIGGAIFKLNDNLLNNTKNNEVDKKLTWYLANGYKDKVDEKIEKLKADGAFGPTDLKPNIVHSDDFNFDKSNFEATTDPTKSQNNFIADILKAKVEVLNSVLQQHDVPSEIAMGQQYNDMVQNITDMKLDSSISSDLESITNDIVSDVAKLRSFEKPKDGATKEEEEAYNNSTREIQKRISDNRKELREIANGDRLQHYFEEAYFNTRPLLNSIYGVKSANDFAESMFNKKYFELNEYEKEKVDEVSDNYESTTKRDQLKISKQQFDNITNFLISKRDQLIERTKKDAAISFDVEEAERRFGKYMDLEEILKTKSFSQLIDLYDNVMRQGTEDESITPTETPYVVNEEALAKETSDIFEKNNGSNLKDFSGLDILNKLLVFAKFKGDKKVLSNEQIKNFPETFTLSDLTGINLGINNIALKDLTQETVDKIKEVKTFTEDQIALIQKALDLKQNIIDYATNIGNQISDKQYNPSFVLGLLKDSSLTLSEKEESKDTFNIFDILEKENQRATDPLFNLGDYIISQKVTEDQIEKSISQINKLAVALHENTIFESGNETSMHMLSENIMERNKKEFDKKGLAFTEEQYGKLVSELNYYRQKLIFLLEVSKQNKGNKIKYDKLSSNTFKAKTILGFFSFEDPQTMGMLSAYTNLENIEKKDGVTLSEDPIIKDLKDKFITILRINGKLTDEQISQNNFILDLSDEDIIEYENIVGKIEQRIYDLFNNGEIENGKETFLNNFIDGLGGESSFRKEFIKMLEENDNNPTKYNPKMENYKVLDSLYHFLYIISYSPKKLNTFFIGKEVDGVTDFEKSPYAPLQSQENAMRYSLAIIGSAGEDNMINRLFEKLELDYLDITKAKDINETQGFSYTFRNAITTSGFPGAGKTTTTEQIARVSQSMGKKVAVYAPMDIQGKNLLKVIGDRDNVTNSKEKDSQNISDFTASIVGKDTYAKLKEVFEKKTWHDYDLNNDKSFPKSTDSEVVLIKAETKKSTDYIFKLNDNNPVVQEAFKKLLEKDPSVIIDADFLIIDEYTHLSPLDFMILEKFSHLYNNIKPLSYIFMGDELQKGYKMDISKDPNKPILIQPNATATYRSPLLTDMIRSGYNNKIDNIIQVQSLLSQTSKMINTSKENPFDLIRNNQITFSYYESKEEGLIGEKIVSEITKEDLLKYSTEEGKVGVVVDSMDDDIVKLIKSLSDAEQANFDIRITSNIQGSEFKNVIIAVKEPAMIKLNKYSGKNALQSLYTYISRSKKSSLILSTAIADGLNVKSIKTTDNSTAQLDLEAVEKYKKLRFEILKSNYDLGSVAEVKESKIKNIVQKTIKSPVQITDALLAELYEYGNQFETETFDHASNISKDAKEKKISESEFGKDKMYLYGFHKRNGYYVDGDGDIIDNDFPTDIASLAGIADKDVVDDSKELQQDLDYIRNIILSKILYNKEGDLGDLLRSFEIKYPTIDFSNFDIVFETRLLDTDNKEETLSILDNSPVFKGSHLNSKGELKPITDKHIHFINIVFKSKENDKQDLAITLSALPNINNENVKAQPHVKEFLNEQSKIYDKYVKDNNNEAYPLIRKINQENPLEIFKQLSGLKMVKSDKIKLNEFVKKYEAYSISKPYIVTDVLEDREGYEYLKGKPFVFISMDKDILPEQLMDRYLNNLQYKDEPNSVQDVKMVFLNMEQIDFTEWLKQNRKYYKEAVKNRKQSFGKGVYENKYLAAKALANLIQNVSYYNYLRDVKNGKIANKTLTTTQSKLLKDFYGSTDSSLTDALLDTLSSRINRIFKRSFIDDLRKNFYSQDTKDKQKFINYMVGEFNKSSDLSELTTEAFSNHLKNNNTSDLSQLFLSVGKDDIKNHRITVMLTSLFYSQASSGNADIDAIDLEKIMDQETVLNGNDLIDISAEQINKLISYKGEFKEGKVYKHASLKHVETTSLPVFAETENNLDDFLVGVDIVSNNMYANMDSLSNIEYKEEIENENKLEEENKSKINKSINESTISYSEEIDRIWSKINYKQDYKKVLEEINNEFKDKIIKDADNSIVFNVIFEKNGSIKFDYIELYANETHLNFSIDINSFNLIKDEEFDSIDLKGRNVELKTKDGKIYEYNIDKDELKLIEDPTKPSVDSSISENLTIFVTQLNNTGLEEGVINELKPEIENIFSQNRSQDLILNDLQLLFTAKNIGDKVFVSINKDTNMIEIKKIVSNMGVITQQSIDQVLSVRDTVIGDFMKNFKDKTGVFTNQIINTLKDKTVEQALEPILDIDENETPSALSILLKDKNFIKILKDENNMEELEKLFNALNC